MVWRILFVCSHDLLALRRWFLHPMWTWDRTNNLCGTQTGSKWAVCIRDPSSQVQSFLLLSDLEWLGCTKDFRENSDNTGIWFCCFLSRCNWSNLCQWIHGFHPYGTQPRASEVSLSNELLHLSLCLGIHAVRIYWQLSRSGIPTCNCDCLHWQWCLSISVHESECNQLTFPIEWSVALDPCPACIRDQLMLEHFLDLCIVSHPLIDLGLSIWQPCLQM